MALLTSGEYPDASTYILQRLSEEEISEPSWEKIEQLLAAFNRDREAEAEEEDDEDDSCVELDTDNDSDRCIE